MTQCKNNPTVLTTLCQEAAVMCVIARQAALSSLLRHPWASEAQRSASRESMPEHCGHPSTMQKMRPFCTLPALPSFLRHGSLARASLGRGWRRLRGSPRSTCTRMSAPAARATNAGTHAIV